LPCTKPTVAVCRRQPAWNWYSSNCCYSKKNKRSTKAASPPHAKPHAEKTTTLLQQHAAGCASKAARADRKLAGIQAKYQQAQLLLQLLEDLDEQLPEDDTDKLWINIMRKTAQQKLEQNGLAAQTKVQLHIHGLRQQETAVREMVDRSQFTVDSWPPSVDFHASSLKV
jgi:hypothetical protein